MKLRCLIIEDEPLAAELIAEYVQQIPFLHLHGVCNNAITAIDVLQQHSIDVIFLDLHLPKLRGFDFLRSLKNMPQIIVITAYSDFAVEGFALNITDYLMKPVEFSRFVTAVNKLVRRDIPEVEQEKHNRKFQFFNVDKKQVKIYHDDILFIESLKEYVRIHTTDSTIVTKFQMGNLESFLADADFIRVHRSYIVALSKINAFTQTTIEIHQHTIPIGRSYSNNVLAQLHKWKGT